MGPSRPRCCCRAAIPPPDFFRLLKTTDVLVHHPYDSFATSVEQFVEQAARDPDVLAIKQTIYRTAGPESAIVRSLIKAAEQGKQVVALVELKARFDEQANIARPRPGRSGRPRRLRARRAEDPRQGAARRPPGRRRDPPLYCHVGTGNYNPQTATLYEDLGLLSADPELGADLTELFNHLTGYSHQGRYRKLLVAPSSLRGEVPMRIERRGANRRGRIVLKMNNLVDPEMIDALYDASQAGADDRPDRPRHLLPAPQGARMVETIRVRSIVGRFLEHSRIYRFRGRTRRRGQSYIGSADLMPRNLDRRVEAVVPVTDRRVPGPAREILTSTSPTTRWPGRSPPTAPGTRSRPSRASRPTAPSRSSRWRGPTVPERPRRG